MSVRKVYFSNSGVPQTGLTLTWRSLLNVSDGSAYTPQPTFTEIGGGWYKFTINNANPVVGVIDGSGTIAASPERYVPVLMDPADYLFETNVIPTYNPTLDALVFTAFLLVNGSQALNANLTSCSLTIYDNNNNALFTVTSTSPTNGAFILTKSSPGLNTNVPYYVVATIVYAGDTYTSLDTYFSLQ